MLGVKKRWLCAVACVVVLPALARGQASGIGSLSGGALSGWTVQNTDAGNFTVADGVLRVEGPTGWLRSAKPYGDVRVRLEFRFLTPDADSGLFVRAAGGDATFMRGWPNQAYQVQIRNPETDSRLPPVGGLFRHGMPQGETSFDAAAVAAAVRPTGEWQALEVTVTGDRLEARLNDRLVLQASGIANETGYLGLQGETGALEFRAFDIEAR